MSFSSYISRSQGQSTIFLVQAPFLDGRNAWYFVRVQLAKVNVLRRAVTSGPINLEDYGEILRSGWGQEPPEDVVKEIKEIYGYRPE